MNGPWAHPNLNFQMGGEGDFFMLLVMMMGSVIGLHHNLLVHFLVAPTGNFQFVGLPCI